MWHTAKPPKGHVTSKICERGFTTNLAIPIHAGACQENKAIGSLRCGRSGRDDVRGRTISARDRWVSAGTCAIRETSEEPKVFAAT